MLDFIEVRDSQWAGFIEKFEETTVFHHPAWIELLAECYGYRPLIAVDRDKKGEIMAGLPTMEINSLLTGKRWVSLPFCDHCRLLFQKNHDISSFLNELIEKNKESNIDRFEIRDKLPPINNEIKSLSFFSHYLYLTKDHDELYKQFRKKGVQYCIKKALKSDIEISQKSDIESILKFYHLHLLTRKKLGVPTQPRKYFIRLCEHIIEKGMGFVMLAKYENKTIAGGVFLSFNKNMIYKYGATDPQYMNLYANHLLLWEAIQWGCRNGYMLFDWGRTEKSNKGLRKFKAGWGTEERELTYSFIGSAVGNYSTGWKHRILENTIQKSPAWVGRLLGELLYKHVG